MKFYTHAELGIEPFQHSFHGHDLEINILTTIFGYAAEELLRQYWQSSDARIWIDKVHGQRFRKEYDVHIPEKKLVIEVKVSFSVKPAKQRFKHQHRNFCLYNMPKDYRLALALVDCCCIQERPLEIHTVLSGISVFKECLKLGLIEDRGMYSRMVKLVWEARKTFPKCWLRFNNAEEAMAHYDALLDTP